MKITDLPPTSYATEGHIQRALYATYMQVNCLGDFSLNPQDCGFTIESECLVPKRCHRNLPDEVSMNCSCVKCATRSCPCGERNSHMGPVQGSRVKSRGQMIAHRTPISPGLLPVIDVISIRKINGVISIVVVRLFIGRSTLTAPAFLPSWRQAYT